MFITNVRVYSLQTLKEFERKIRLEYIMGVTRSIDKGNLEVVVHVRDSYDFRLKAQNEQEQNEIIDALKDAYFKVFRCCLTVYGVPAPLTPYIMTQADLKKDEKERPQMPSELFRLEQKKSKKVDALNASSDKACLRKGLPPLSPRQ